MRQTKCYNYKNRLWIYREYNNICIFRIRKNIQILNIRAPTHSMLICIVWNEYIKSNRYTGEMKRSLTYHQSEITVPQLIIGLLNNCTIQYAMVNHLLHTHQHRSNRAEEKHHDFHTRNFRYYEKSRCRTLRTRRTKRFQNYETRIPTNFRTTNDLPK